MEEVEVAEYFLCPISLQIMQDPVIAATGITYDRSSIEKWLSQSHNTICPVSQQPLPRHSPFTPNHILLKLIQTWRTTPSPTNRLIPNIQTHAHPINKFYVLKLITQLSLPNFLLHAVMELESLAKQQKHRPCLVEAGVPDSMLHFITTCHKNTSTVGLEQAIGILSIIWYPSNQTKQFPLRNDEIIESLTWALECDTSNKLTHSHAMVLLKMFMENANSKAQETWKLDFFKTIVMALTKGMTPKGTKAALDIMLGACPWGRNRGVMVEAGGVYALVEVLLLGLPDKRNSEVVLQILFHLCCCADGRAGLVGHAAGIAVVTRRIMKVSPAADDSAISIISLLTKYSGTDWVLQEMLVVGAVTRLCLLLQTNCGTYLKEKTSDILRRHTHVWKHSLCFYPGIPFDI